MKNKKKNIYQHDVVARARALAVEGTVSTEGDLGGNTDEGVRSADLTSISTKWQ